MEHGLVLAGSGYGNVAGCRVRGKEHLGSIKFGEFLDQLQTY